MATFPSYMDHKLKTLVLERPDNSLQNQFKCDRL